MAIKMRINQNKKSICDECGCVYQDTKEMYTIKICGTTFDLCSMCIDTIFKKTLKADCIYNQKLKNKEDMKRVEREIEKYGTGYWGAL